MTEPTGYADELAWDHAAHEIPDAGLSARREAAPDELARVARALDLLDCPGLAAEYAISPAASGRYRLSGRLRAEVVQACVVTLEPVASTIEESFEAMFWPPEDMPQPQGGEVAMDEGPEPEPLVAGRIGVGRVVFECLAMAIDPFPRTSDARLEQHAAEPAAGAAADAASPFAVLATLKSRG